MLENNTKYPNKFQMVGETITYDFEFVGGDKPFRTRFEGYPYYYSENDLSGLSWSHYKMVPDEPDLVFPFVAQHCSGFNPFTVYDQKDSDFVSVVTVSGYVIDDIYTTSRVKTYIKDGAWLVKSVGAQKPLEQPVSPPESIKLGSVQIDVQVALDSVNELREALLNLEIVYTRVKVLFGGEIGIK